MATPKRSSNSVHLTQKDVTAAVAFYRDKLGFQLDETWPDAKAPLWASMSLDGQVVMLGAAMDPSNLGVDEMHPEAKNVFISMVADWKLYKPGVGVQLYLMTADVDAFHREVVGRGGKPLTGPVSQFYGIRDFMIEDPSGYRLNFYTNITMQSCQSCGMPLTGCQPGQIYCNYCTDENGKLKPFEQVLEGTIQGYFMGMQKMARTAAEVAAKEHLKKMPAWMMLKP